MRIHTRDNGVGVIPVAEKEIKNKLSKVVEKKIAKKAAANKTNIRQPEELQSIVEQQQQQWFGEQVLPALVPMSASAPPLSAPISTCYDSHLSMSIPMPPMSAPILKTEFTQYSRISAPRSGPASLAHAPVTLVPADAHMWGKGPQVYGDLATMYSPLSSSATHEMPLPLLLAPCIPSIPMSASVTGTFNSYPPHIGSGIQSPVVMSPTPPGVPQSFFGPMRKTW
ncbi:hypothetical protein GGI07_000369 [Coemansia sp. Benny D115]|nr:hypothetical protein GGI07_000369 [Coemansia sp. Benny D115]